jgi:hypothetical protein
VLALEGEHKSYPAFFILDQQPQYCRLEDMKLVFRKLLIALAFGFGAMAAPAALIIIEAANAPQPEVRNPVEARTLLSQGRLAWDDQQTTAGRSGNSGYQGPEPGSGY